ncbi:amidase [Pedobacter psychrophilus]|uniref:Amidase n=1 Tax=Pedobacter psychrophilus TaxID=1826909 RepID=A0A179DH92_9SPHI|nr:amidase [Pedobacter psychrophilus]OAQ40446.1 amidase [Pedobacter psychrophilus]
MNRRKFIFSTSVAAAASTALASTSFLLQAKEKVNQASDDVFADDFELNEITIDQLQEKMEKGKLTSKTITEMYLKRIAKMDKKGPLLNAVIELNPDAIKIAKQMDDERKNGKIRSRMHGIPVLIKDNIDTGDKMMTTAGATALIGNIASKDAFIVQQLRNAGAVLLGKTNLSEWANFKSSKSTSGWSSRGGQTRMPYILDRNPSGSSAGTGAAVAANFCVIGIGTETDGSITSPSSMNGLVGIKPTVGLLSRTGIIPISATQDTAGPMGRTVKDAAIFLGVLAGLDANDPVTLESKGKAKTDYTLGLSLEGLKGKRIGVEKSFFRRGNQEVINIFKDSIQILKDKGAIIIEVELLKKINEGGDNGEFEVLQYEFKDGLNKYLATANTKVKTLAEVISFNKANEKTVMPYFKQETLESSNAKEDLSSKPYKDALIKSTSSRKIISSILKDSQLDAICGISNGPAACIDNINGDYGTGFSFSGPAATAGYPHITLPMGMLHQLPIGISFIANAYQEAELIKITYAFEQATKMRKAPKFIPTAIQSVV